MPYTVGIYTLGCKVSQYESIAIAEGFKALGFSVLPVEEECDVYVINTCTVTAESDRKCRQIIRRAAKKKAVVMVCGCYSQVSKDEVASIEGVSYVGGNYNKNKIPEIALRLLREREYVSPIIDVTDIETGKVLNSKNCFIFLEFRHCAIAGINSRLRKYISDSKCKISITKTFCIITVFLHISIECFCFF